MKTIMYAALLAGLLAGAPIGFAQKLEDPAAAQIPPELVKLAKELHYQQGEIDLKGGLAKLKVPPEFHFLDAKDAQTVLVKMWGNPPEVAEDTLGLLMPADQTPLQKDCWVVAVSYAADGYVKDDDATKINYDKLLQQMQKATAKNNAARTKEGYPALELVGWAAPPHYDAATHKLYWAKELKFEGNPVNTLNYDIRMLGRRGVLVLSAVADINQLAAIEKQTPAILGMVDFNEGHRYADFDPKVDKVATYGLAALVAGGIATKLGLFKLLWVGILAAKKFIIIGVAAVAAWMRKFFNRRKDPAA